MLEETVWSLKVFRQKKGVVETFVVNPKSVSLGNLYGEIDPNTLEWSDGLVAKVFRNFAKKYSGGSKEPGGEKEDGDFDDAASVDVVQGGVAEDIVTTVVDNFTTGIVTIDS
jgi:hypothetical protein